MTIEEIRTKALTAKTLGFRTEELAWSICAELCERLEELQPKRPQVPDLRPHSTPTSRRRGR